MVREFLSTETIPCTCLAFSPWDRADDIFLMEMIRLGLVPSFAPGLSSRGYLCICALFCGNRSVDIRVGSLKKFVPGFMIIKIMKRSVDRKVSFYPILSEIFKFSNRFDKQYIFTRCTNLSSFSFNYVYSCCTNKKN